MINIWSGFASKISTKFCPDHFFENKKKKVQKNFDLQEQGFEPQIFSNFPAHDLNFHGK